MDTAFCTKCRKQVVIDEEEQITMALSGRAAVKGVCEICRRPIYKLLPMPQRKRRGP
jgi:Domain of unknown function (DUF5679)